MSRQALQLFDSSHHQLLSCLNPILASVSQARQAHAHILKTGLSNQTRFTTKLLSLYANNSRFDDAYLFLDSIPAPDVFDFSTLIYACSKSNFFSRSLRLFSRMQSLGLSPDARLLPTAVKACAGISGLKVGQQVHGFASTLGLASDPFVQSSLVHMYVKCNRLFDAHRLFDEMPEPDIVSWSALVAGYARQGFVNEAKNAFDEMLKLGIEPNSVSWNGIIAGFNQSKHYSEAILMFNRMHLQGFNPDGTSISSVLPAIGDLEDFYTGIQVHCCVIKLGLESDNCTVSALIDMYGKCGRALEMTQVFDEMTQTDIAACNALLSGLSRNSLSDKALSCFEKFKVMGIELNVVSWTSAIACCTQNGKDIEALELFREMQIAGFTPNYMTIPCLLPACGNISALSHGKATHCFSIKREISNDVYVGSALIDMYANCGKIQISRLCFDQMPTRNLVCWNSMMGGYAMHGKADEAIKVFDLMERSGQRPDIVSFTCLLSACSQRGLIEEGWHFFNAMSKYYEIEPRVEHYACMVTLLGGLGKLEEAYSMVKNMPFEPDACVWGALLSSCRVHHNVGLGEIAAKELFGLEPRNPGNYILLANIYASKGKWDEVHKVRDMMKGMGLRKNPGCSWIEFKNKIHMLLSGDKLHPQMKQIVEKIDELDVEMKKLGYVPSTDFVLHDVEEHEKENMLCSHSEKLAVVLGLLNTVSGSPLRVMKNLRICGDCHSVIKFISGFEGREIFVRDTNRYHHFKDGECSCGDYW